MLTDDRVDAAAKGKRVVVKVDDDPVMIGVIFRIVAVPEDVWEPVLLAECKPNGDLVVGGLNDWRTADELTEA